MATDYPILSAPRISEATFTALLRSGSSPATPEAGACYRAFTAAGVDPAVALGVFRKESSMGRAGRAARNRSWGNIRGRQAGFPVDGGNFRIYPSWSAGALDAARLLAIYGRNQIRPGTNTSTVRTFPYVWAPSSDGNAPAKYGATIAGWIAQWSGQGGSDGVGNGSGASTGRDETYYQLLKQKFGSFVGQTYGAIIAGGPYAPWDAIPETFRGFMARLGRSEADVFTDEDLRAIAGAYESAPANNPDPVGAVVAALGPVVVNAVVLAAILAVIILALYRISES